MSRDVCLQGELSAGEAQHSYGHGDQHLVLVTLGLGNTIFTPASVCRVAGCQTTACAFSVMTVPEMWSKTLAEPRMTRDSHFWGTHPLMPKVISVPTMQWWVGLCGQTESTLARPPE